MTLDLLGETGTWEAVAFCLVTAAMVYFDIKVLGNTEIYKSVAGCLGIPIGCGLLLALPFVIIGIATSASVEPRPLEERVLGIKMIAAGSATLPFLIALFHILGGGTLAIREWWRYRDRDVGDLFRKYSVGKRHEPRPQMPKPPRPQDQASQAPNDSSFLDRLLAHRLVGLIGFIAAVLGIITFVLHLLYKW